MGLVVGTDEEEEERFRFAAPCFCCVLSLF